MGNRQASSRRSFLHRVSALALGAPYLVRSSALGRAGVAPASERITIGLIGCGNHGAGWNLDQIFRCRDAQVIAVCDVDVARCKRAKEKVERHYCDLFGKQYAGCTPYGDFRDLVMQKDIDTVAICTPDHWHVIPAIMAARVGKDVICEKPLTLTVGEGRTLCRVVAETKRVFQTASENRSIDSYVRLCELVRNGRIGKVNHVHVTLPGGNETRGDNFMQRDPQPPPLGFNYDMWLGQAPWAPYVPARCHGSFRWNLDYSGGRLTDWGAHLIDLAQWGLGSESTGPVEVEGTGEFPPREALFNTASAFDLHYTYAGGVTLRVSSSQPGIRFDGRRGWIGFRGWRAPLEASDESILESAIGRDEIRLGRPEVLVRRDDYSAGGEHRDFLNCVKSRRPCYAPAETGHRTITIAHIGNIAMRLGRRLKWDPATERFDGDDEANQMLYRKQRVPWTMASVDAWIAQRS